MSIPKKIIQYWDHPEIPDDVRELMTTWSSGQPDFEYQLFDRNTARGYLVENHVKRVVEAFDEAAIPAMRSDIFRVAYISREGGMYIDAATRNGKGITDLFDTDNRLVLMRKWHGGVWNGFLLSQVGNPVLKEVLFHIVENVRLRARNDVWSTTGPGVFNNVIDGNSYSGVEVLDQRKITKYFRLVNDLGHKKDDHWSRRQKSESIYVSPEAETTASRERTRQILLHLGPHKTATTSFQKSLEAQSLQLNRSGIRLITVRSGIAEEYREWRNTYTRILQGYLLGKRRYEDAALEVRCSLVDLFDSESLADFSQFILSDENLLGPMPGHYFAGRLGRAGKFYEAAPLLLESLDRLFSRDEVSIIVARRSLKGFILSSYKDFISKLTDSESLIDFYRSLSDEFSADYQVFFQNLQERPGKKGQVIAFDDFICEAMDAVELFFGIRLDRSSFDGMRANTSLTWRAVDMARRIGPVLNDNYERRQVAACLRNRVDGDSEEMAAEREQFDDILRAVDPK